MSESTVIQNMQDQKRRAFWLKHLHQWHWISSAVSLIAMLAFAATGLTLNHAAQIEATPQVVRIKAQLPDTLLQQLKRPENGEIAKKIRLCRLSRWPCATGCRSICQ